LTRQIPVGEHLWLGLAQPKETPWVQVRAVRVKKTLGGRVMIALHFPLPCDYEFFKTVVYGDDAKERQISNSPEFRDRDWR
jgi:hypothetical protein